MNTVKTSTKETENIKYQTEVTELKNTITALKNRLDGLKIRQDEAKERISTLEDIERNPIREAKRKKK